MPSPGFSLYYWGRRSRFGSSDLKDCQLHINSLPRPNYLLLMTEQLYL